MSKGETVDAVLWVPIILIGILAALGVYWAYWHGEVRSKNKR